MHPDVAKLVEAGKINEAVGKRLTEVSPGHYCVHKSWGAGKVISWDLAGGKVVINFETNPNQEMGLKMAVQKTEVLDGANFKAQKLESLDELRSLAESDPVELLKRTLKSSGGTMKMDAIDRELKGSVIPEDKYSKWWDGAKKALRESRVAIVPSKRTDPIVLRDEDMSSGDSLLMDYATARDLKAKAKALEVINKEHKQLADQPDRLQELVNDIDDTARKGLKMNLGVSMDMLASRDELLARFENLELSGSALRLPEVVVIETERLGESLSGLTAVRQREIYEVFPDAFGDSWIEEVLKIFDKVGARGLAEIAKFLNDKDKIPALNEHLRKHVLGRTLGADSLLWISRERKKLAKEVFDHEVGTAILSLLERDSMDDGPRKSSRLQSYFMEDKELISDLLADGDLQIARNFARKLLNGQVFPELDQKSLMARVIRARPETQDLVTGEDSDSQREGWVSSWDSLQRMKDELQLITSKKIPQNREDIKIAKSYGDLKENAEYHMAKDQQKVLVSQKADLEKNIHLTQGTDFSGASTDSVNIGTVVKLEGGGKKDTVTVLGAWDSDPDKSIVGYTTVLGAELLGKNIGDEVNNKGDQMKITGIEFFNQG